jgi:hypothetical protein
LGARDSLEHTFLEGGSAMQRRVDSGALGDSMQAGAEWSHEVKAQDGGMLSKYLGAPQRGVEGHKFLEGELPGRQEGALSFAGALVQQKMQQELMR